MGVNELKKIASLCLVCSLGVLGCSSASSEDPFEPVNRVMHEFNKVSDTVLLNPVSKVYDAVTDADVQQIVANAASNLNEPRNAVNHVLQGEIEAAAINSTRFIYNSTVGILGMRDPAANLGLFPAPTNFNQTMAKWGVDEGPYVELPVLGPNTFRSVAGLVVDTQINPLTQFMDANAFRNYNYFVILSRINDRARYGNLVDMLLYQSPDSYLATRLAYLQSQRSMSESVTGEDQSETVDLENFYE